MRTTPIVLILVVLTGLGAAADERVKRGMRAPPLQAHDQVGIEDFSIAGSRGRFVLLQFFSVRCQHCQKFVPRMNTIDERYRRRGITTLGVTHESRADVMRFRRQYGARYPVVLAHYDVGREYGIEEYPTGFLIAPNGRIVWRGNPSRMTDRVFDAYLGKFPLMPALPRRYETVGTAIGEGRFADAYGTLDRQRSCQGISQSDCRFVLGTLDWLDGYARSSLDAARRDEDAERWYDAWWTYDHLATGYAGLPTAIEAGNRRDALLADASRKGEIEAWRALVEARTAARRQRPQDGVVLFVGVAKAHPKTPAATRSRELAGVWVAQ